MLEQLEQQKRLTANQWKLIATTNLADLLDFFDFFLIGYVLAFITKEWQLTYWQGAMILLSSLLSSYSFGRETAGMAASDEALNRDRSALNPCSLVEKATVSRESRLAC